MVNYKTPPLRYIERKGVKIASFVNNHRDSTGVVESFNKEWEKFSEFSLEEIENAGNEYFDIVDSTMLNKSSIVLDVGCGSGRWTRYASSRAGFVEGMDIIDNVYNAAVLNKGISNVRITHASIEDIPFPDNSFDFVFCLGVLHHLKDTELSLKRAVDKVKPGGYFLMYTYYKLENTGLLLKILFWMSIPVRLVVSRLPTMLKFWVCDLIALVIYLPFVWVSRLVKNLFPNGETYKSVPLHYYHDKSLHIIRNDSLDRFGTALEKRFSKAEVREMLNSVGIDGLVFSDNAPNWHVVGKKPR